MRCQRSRGVVYLMSTLALVCVLFGSLNLVMLGDHDTNYKDECPCKCAKESPDKDSKEIKSVGHTADPRGFEKSTVNKSTVNLHELVLRLESLEKKIGKSRIIQAPDADLINARGSQTRNFMGNNNLVKTQGQNDQQPTTIGLKSTEENKNPGGKRKGLIIVGLSRSGTSFISKMFNSDPRIFNAYEPMQVPNRWPRSKEVIYEDAASDVITSIMTCDFTQSHYSHRFLKEMSVDKRYRMASSAFASQPLCDKSYIYETCHEMQPKNMSEICAKRYQMSILKVVYARLPKESHIETLFPIIRNNRHCDLKILHIVRDPRGNFDSRIRMNWIRDVPNPDLGKSSAKICGIVERNIKTGEEFRDQEKDRYKKVSYTEFFSNPVEKAKEIYQYIGLEMPASVKKWILANTNPPEKERKSAESQQLSLIRDSKANVVKWKNAPLERTQILENSCGSLIKLLGHEFIT